MAPMLPLLVPSIRLSTLQASVEEERSVARAREPWVAGFCLFGGEVEQVRSLTRRLREAAGRPLFVASDMECGAGQQVKGLPVLPEAAVWGRGASPREVEAFGEATARDALSVGVDVLFAPVLDVMSEPGNPIVGHRAYGWDPVRVAALGVAWMRGALRGGALPVAKHYPGHGATLADSHDAVPVVEDPASRIEARDFVPFHAALDAGVCPAVMTAHVVYPALDPSGVVATLSPVILGRLRERDVDVAVFTDALSMRGVCAPEGEEEAARRALLAGCDLLLCPTDPEAVAAGLDELPARVLEAAASRVRALLDRAAQTLADAGPPGEGALDDALVLAVARRAVALSWSGEPEQDRVLVLDDDDVPGRGEVLRARGEDVGVPVTIVRPSRFDAVPSLFEGDGTVVVMASVRSVKGPRGVTPAGRAALARLRARVGNHRLRLVWCGPVPDGAGIHVPGTGGAVERALAEVLLSRRA